jgi:rhodanese-related sulfurtransferase
MRSLAFKIIKYLINRKYPTVALLTTKELAQWLNAQSKPQPILLDARSEAEYQLSHLQQAERIDPYHPNLEAITISKDMPIVVYCSVGYRSARIAQQLQQAGFSHVYNLEGSIFQWANEKRPVYKNDCPTTLVHPYDKLWGQLLNPRFRALVKQG